jgi:hypothetical protein
LMSSRRTMLERRSLSPPTTARGWTWPWWPLVLKRLTLSKVYLHCTLPHEGAQTVEPTDRRQTPSPREFESKTATDIDGNQVTRFSLESLMCCLRRNRCQWNKNIAEVVVLVTDKQRLPRQRTSCLLKQYKPRHLIPRWYFLLLASTMWESGTFPLTLRLAKATS